MTTTARRLASPEARTWGLLAMAAGAVLLGGLYFPAAYPLPISANGALFGTSTGLLAVGLVLIYRTTRIINFAYGGMGTLAATVAIGLHRERDVPWYATIAVAAVAGLVVGALVERLVIRRFERAPRLVVTVATIGVAQVPAGLMSFLPGWLDLPVVLPSFPTPLSQHRWRTEQWTFNGNDLALLALVPVVLVGLGWFLTRRSGIAVRGIADNLPRARLLGIPVHRLSLLLWALAGAVAALTVTLRAPNAGLPLDAAAGPAILLPPLAAAVVARFHSLGIAFVAGVATGVLDQLVQWNFPDRRELRVVAFLAVIALALLVQRRPASRALVAGESSWTTVSSAERLPVALRRLPEVRVAGGLLVAAAVAVAVLIPVFGRTAQVNYATLTLIFALGALSLVVLSGWGGVLSLGQVALMGAGGIVAANLIADRNTDWFLTLAASAVAGGVVALLLGIPGLRVVGAHLGVITLAFAIVVEQYVIKPALHAEWLPARFERPELWGEVDLADERALYTAVAVVLVVVAALVANLRRSRSGRSIVAVRDNERRAAAAGVSGSEHRLAAFVFAGGIAGLAGALHVTTMRGIGEQSYPTLASLLLFSMAVIGGVSSIGGAIAGVVLVRWASYLFPSYTLLISGLGVVVVLMLLSGGLAQGFELLRDRFALACARRRGIDAGRGKPRAPGGRGRGIGKAAGKRSRRGRSRPGHGIPPLLAVSGLDASYGSFQVLADIDVAVAKGEMLALLGTNGAGKSSLLATVCGLLPPSAGRITFDGTDITGWPPERIAARGISLVPGGKGIFAALTVGENLRLAGWRQRGPGGDVARDEVLALFPVVRQRWAQRAGDLSGGEQQQLSLAMSLLTRPRLLLIDELSLGLAPAIVAQLVDKVRQIHREGTTVVVVEQSVSVALLLCEQAVFLEQGRVRFHGPTARLLDRRELLRAVFLGTPPQPATTDAPEGGADDASATRGVALVCRGLSKRFGGLQAIAEVDLDVRAGEIVGLVGHNGAGKTTLFDVIGGFLPADDGAVLLGDTEVTALAPHRRAIASLGRSFQDARLFGSLTVAETIAVSLETHLGSRCPVSAALRLPPTIITERAVARRIDEVVELVGLGRYRDRPVGELSTGTRRIVELACLIAQDPAVILLDEPLAGVAQREAEEFPALLRSLRDATGSAMVIVEHNMPVLSELSDRFVALELGAVIATGTPADVLADDRVIASYLGTDEFATA